MNTVYIISILTGIIYILFAELDKRFSSKQNSKEEDKREMKDKPFKTMMKQLVYVTVASVSAFFVVNQCKKMFNIDKTPNVFVNDPEF